MSKPTQFCDILLIVEGNSKFATKLGTRVSLTTALEISIDGFIMGIYNCEKEICHENLYDYLIHIGQRVTFRRHRELEVQGHIYHIKTGSKARYFIET
jgi:hypothetical protein